MTFWNVFFGVFAGIIAGIAINFAIEALRNCKINRKMVKNLKFEIEFNIKKIDSFLDDFKRYRQHIDSDSPYEYFGMLKFSGLLKTTLQQMFLDRSVYKLFGYENIGRLQTFMADFQSDDVARIKGSIDKFRELKDVDEMRRVANKFSDYIEEALKGAKNNLETVRIKGGKD